MLGARHRVLVYDSTNLQCCPLVERLGNFESTLETTCIHNSELLLQLLNTETDCVVVVSESVADCGNLSIVRRLRKFFPRLPVAVLIGEKTDRERRIIEVFKAGAKGVLSCSDDPAKIAKCILSLSRGEVWATRRELTTILDALARNTQSVVDSSPKRRLTRREEEVAGLVARGFSNPQISGELQLSESRVRNCIAHIFTKSGVSRRLELVHRISRAAQPANSRPIFKEAPNVDDGDPGPTLERDSWTSIN